MSTLTIASLRGGMNNADPPIALADDQVTLAQNVEWTRSTLGERRRGAIQIDLTGGALAACDKIVWTHRHLPTSDPSAAQFWALGITGSTAVLAYKDTTWHTVTMSDALTVDGVSEYQVDAVSLHGKLFIAYNSSVDRLHVWDGTSLRRTGLAEPAAAPTAADTGSGSFSGTRYYRVRYAVYSGGGVLLRRSEPSDTLAFAPAGTGSGAIVTKPATISEGETHWELEASVNNADFYRITTADVGTPTFTDTNTTSYLSLGGAVSDQIGDYTLQHSARLVIADEDRLLLFGAHENPDLESSASWTPVYNATGVGNDERLPLDPVSVVNLDGYEGGRVTAVSRATAGTIRVFKQAHAYTLIHTGINTRAYDATVVTKSRGALAGSVVEGLDHTGYPAVFFLDPDVGPCVFSKGGILRCGRDMSDIWPSVNLDASVVCRSVYIPSTQQIVWFVAYGSAMIPSAGFVLHTNEMRQSDAGELRRGWALWTGAACAPLATCLFSINIDDDTARSQTLVPFLGMTGNGLVWRMNTGDDDNGTAYSATLRTKPFAPGGLQTQIEVKTAHLVARSAEGASLIVGAIPDFGLTEIKYAEPVELGPTSANETHVIKHLGDLGLAECETVAFDISDPPDPGTRWELARLVVTLTGGMGAG